MAKNYRLRAAFDISAVEPAFVAELVDLDPYGLLSHPHQEALLLIKYNTALGLLLGYYR